MKILNYKTMLIFLLPLLVGCGKNDIYSHHWTEHTILKKESIAYDQHHDGGFFGDGFNTVEHSYRIISDDGFECNPNIDASPAQAETFYENVKVGEKVYQYWYRKDLND